MVDPSDLGKDAYIYSIWMLLDGSPERWLNHLFPFPKHPWKEIQAPSDPEIILPIRTFLKNKLCPKCGSDS